MRRSSGKFEKEWQETFDGVEARPRNELWTKIESALANQQVRRYRRKIFVYKLLVAATVIFAIGLGYFRWQDIPDSGAEIPLATRDENSEVNTDPGNSDPAQSGLTEGAGITEISPSEIPIESTASELHDHPLGIVQESDSEKAKSTSTTKPVSPDDVLRESIHLPFISGNKIPVPGFHPNTIKEPSKKTDPFNDQIIVEAEDNRQQQKEAKLWAGVSLASGVFDPNISYGSRSSFLVDQISPSGSDAMQFYSDPSTNVVRSSPPEKTAFNPEFSYSYGINMGYELSEKFILMSGLSYLYNATSTTINSYIESSVSNKKYANQAIYSLSAGTEGISNYNSASEEIVLNNIYEFVSVPVQVGYYLINENIQWVLTGGVSTDILLKNTVYDPDDFLEPLETTSEENSPYKSSYLSGIMGTSVNYMLNDRYLIKLEPSYRLGLSYLTREEASFNSRPSTFIITAGISYIIK